MTTSPADPDRRTDWVSVWALSIGIFGMVVVEEIPIGVLLLIGEDLTASDATVGLSVTLAGVLAALTSLLVPVVGSRVHRRTILVWAMVLMTLSCVGSALAPSIELFLASRLFLGLALGMFWAVAAMMPTKLARAADVPKASAVIFGGASVAGILGIPGATWVGQSWGWQSAFWLCAGLGVVLTVLLRVRLHPTPGSPTQLTFRQYVDVAKHPRVWASVSALLVLVAAHFAVYTYAARFITERGGVPADNLQYFFLLAGTAGLLGTAGVGWLLPKLGMRTIALVATTLGITLLVAWPLAVSPIATAVVLACWALFSGMIASGIQGVINTGPDRLVAPATGLTSAAFNVSIASGAALGGAIAAAAGLSMAFVVSGALCFVALLPLVAYWQVWRRHPDSVA